MLQLGPRSPCSLSCLRGLCSFPSISAPPSPFVDVSSASAKGPGEAPRQLGSAPLPLTAWAADLGEQTLRRKSSVLLNHRGWGGHGWESDTSTTWYVQEPSYVVTSASPVKGRVENRGVDRASGCLVELLAVDFSELVGSPLESYPSVSYRPLPKRNSCICSP